MRSRVLAGRERSVVIVTTKAGRSYRGVLWDFDRTCAVLRNAEALDGDVPLPIDGELLLMWSDVEFVNRP